MRRIVLCAAALLLLLHGCSSDSGSDASIAATQLPRLERIHVPALDSLGPERSSAMLAVALSGRLAFTTGFTTANRLITVIDTGGKLIHRLAPRGNGPGELEAPDYAFMAYSGDTLLVYNGNKERLITFGPDGQLLGTTPSFKGGMALRIAADSSDFILMDLEAVGQGFAAPGIARVSSSTGAGRVFLRRTDSAYDSLRGEAPWAVSLPSPVASRASMIVVGDPFKYQFQSFDRDGRPLQQWRRDVPQRFRPEAVIDSMVDRERAASRGRSANGSKSYEEFVRGPLRHFIGINFDDSGRLWAFGRDDRDSTFADVFSDTTYLGRISGPCQNRSLLAPAMRGDFFLILCAAPTKDSGVELRLYRMVAARQ